MWGAFLFGGRYGVTVGVSVVIGLGVIVKDG